MNPFQNLAANIVEVQTLKGIVLLGGDFNVHIVALPNSINISDLCELLQALELAKTKQPVMWLNDRTAMLVLTAVVMSS